MKKVLVLFTAIITMALISVSCALDDPDPNFNAAFLPVVSIDVPESMHPGTTYSFKLYYNRPTDCYYYDGLYNKQDGNDFVIAVSSIVLDQNCQPLQHTEPEVAVFDFQCPQSSFQEYTFHFYSGESATGEDEYMDVTVPVE
jgi:hypothetical protein